MSAIRTPITTRIDFEKDGKQVGHLRLPHSSNISAYGWIGIPIAVIKNGTGPTVMVSAGIHGDEYEGQIVLGELIRGLDAGRIQGRLIVLPSVNTPAAVSGDRCSPIDGLNLNRCFPGDPDGSPTEQLAHYVEAVLLPMVDNALDFHCGGKTLDYLPSALMRPVGGEAMVAKKRAALEAFGARIGYIVSGIHGQGTYVAALDRAGIVGLGTELGGAGTVRPETMRATRIGLWNMLEHYGIIEHRGPDADRGVKPRITRVPGPECYLYAPCAGLLEPLFSLGDEVEAGQLAARIHDQKNPERAPAEVHWETGGLVICSRPILKVDLGDCLGHLAIDEPA